VEDLGAESILYQEFLVVAILLATIATRKATLLENAESLLKVVALEAQKAKMGDASYAISKVTRKLIVLKEEKDTEVVAIEIETDLCQRAQEVQGDQKADLLPEEVESKFILQNIAHILINTDTTEMIQDPQRERGLNQRAGLRSKFNPRSTDPKVEMSGQSPQRINDMRNDLTQDSLGLEALEILEVALMMALDRDLDLMFRILSRSANIRNLATKKLSQALISPTVIFLQTKSTAKKPTLQL
jgi:hypothetical protein